MHHGRRQLLAALLGIVVLAAALAPLFLSEKRPPDIVLVVWDTCRADRISAYGYGVDTTPWLRQFARDAVLYEQAYSPAPWTPPAHASMFTGLLPFRHGLVQGREHRVATHIPVLASTLRDAGYETVAITCNAYISKVTGLDRGFDTVLRTWNEADGVGKSVDALAGLRSLLAARHQAPAGRPRRPLFLFINLMDTHLPWMPAPEDLRAVLGDRPVPPEMAMAMAITERDALGHMYGERRIESPVLAGAGAVYDATVHQVDRATGEIALRLRAEGILDDAFVAVVGDHGEHLGEHGHLSHQASLYREVLHVPMVVRWPGRLDGGRVETAQVRLQDLYPTILEAARVPIPAGNGLDAASLTESPLRSRVHLSGFQRANPFVPDANGAPAGAGRDAFRRLENSLYGFQDPLDAPRPRKLILHERLVEGGKSVPDGEFLYDPVADPGETRNLLENPTPEDRAAADRLRALR